MGSTYDNFHGHSFVFEETDPHTTEGKVFCRSCAVRVSWEGWAQHIHGKVKGRKTSHIITLESAAATAAAAVASSSSSSCSSSTGGGGSVMDTVVAKTPSPGVGNSARSNKYAAKHTELTFERKLNTK